MPEFCLFGIIKHITLKENSTFRTAGPWDRWKAWKEGKRVNEREREKERERTVCLFLTFNFVE